jgi:hypothetical protein
MSLFTSYAWGTCNILAHSSEMKATVARKLLSRMDAQHKKSIATYLGVIPPA